MYNDGSEDNFKQEIAIVPKKFIEIRKTVEKNLYSSRQIEIYNNYVRRKVESVFHDYGWAIFLDIDEYLVSPLPINNFIDLIPEDVSQIRLSWLPFGSRNQIKREQGLTIERFTECDLSHKKGKICKSLFRPNKVTYADVHFSQVKGKTVSADLDFVCRGDSFFSPKVHSGLYVAHYSVKSLEEFDRKVARGYNTAHPNVPNGYFNESNAKGDFVNDAAKLAPYVKMQIESWRLEYVNRDR